MKAIPYQKANLTFSSSLFPPTPNLLSPAAQPSEGNIPIPRPFITQDDVP